MTDAHLDLVEQIREADRLRVSGGEMWIIDHPSATKSLLYALADDLRELTNPDVPPTEIGGKVLVDADFRKKLIALINETNMDGATNAADDILADFLMEELMVLRAFTQRLGRRVRGQA